MINRPSARMVRVSRDYRGEIGVLVVDHGTEPVTIEHGMRVAQVVLAPALQAVWRQAKATANAWGLGSTVKGLDG